MCSTAVLVNEAKQLDRLGEHIWRMIATCRLARELSAYMYMYVNARLLYSI